MNYDYDQHRYPRSFPIALTHDWRELGQQLVFMAGIFALVFIAIATSGY